MSIASRIAAAIVTLAPLVHAQAARAEGTRIAIVGVRNDPNGAVAGELGRALCGQLECAPRAKVMAGARIDFEAARREGVDGLLFGTVQGTGASRALALALLRGSMQPSKTWRIPLDARGALSASALAVVQRDLAGLSASRAARPAEPVGEERAAAPERQAAPAAVEAEPQRPVRAPPAEARTAAPRPPAPAAPAPASAAPGAPRRDTLAAADLGVWALQRRLSYQGVGATTSTLRDFRGGTIVAPAIRAELFPLAGRDGWYAGLGLVAGYARSVGFQTEEAPSGAKHDTVFSALDVGAAWRAPRLGSMGLLLTPTIGYRQVAFQASGAGIPGLPDAALGGVAVSLAAELPVVARWAVLAGGGYVLWTSKGDLVGGKFFPGGSASAFQGELGLEAPVAGPLAVRVIGFYELTTYSLDRSTAYTATGATDRYAGVRALVRARF